ncbi:MAG: NUDIX hydrolase [Gammaproteobacteria bacterium]|nr:NUDIX hydrolase [Gammaproteobacteria bacterium]MCW8911423.1 NUDIX hydrolase [Gammaproteobacteria bacterium]MCW9003996.1 NUDIX hydrolase [Gammaproteobacteria bacterium]MCW9055704.1 NUDIX hydrolase [Gammaproteobacteria bacterium]
MIWKPHATVAAIIERDNQFLMVEEECEGRIVFNQPAGHLDPGESFIDAVIRETWEETAWRLHPEAITGLYRWQQPETKRTYTRIAFCGQCDDHRAEQTLDEGIIRAVWMTRDELIEKSPQLRSPMVIRCIDDYLAGHRYPLELLIDI